MALEIKVRAYSHKWKRMVYHGVDGYEIDVMGKTVWRDASDDETASFMLCTGRKDMSGNDIWDGDVNEDGGVVEWNEDDASFCWAYGGVDLQPMEEEEKWCIVKGNIYED